MLISHRGRGWGFSENTIDAFRAALEGGADGIECDFRLGDDGALFVCHDRQVRGRRAEALSGEDRARLQMPLLQEVLDLEQRHPGQAFLFEAKTAAAGERFLEEASREPGMVLISFVDEIIRRGTDAGWETVLLETTSPDVLRDRLPAGSRPGPSVSLAYGLRGVDIERSYVWTVNNLDDGEFFQDRAAWAIGTDYVRAIRQAY